MRKVIIVFIAAFAAFSVEAGIGNVCDIGTANQIPEGRVFFGGDADADAMKKELGVRTKLQFDSLKTTNEYAKALRVFADSENYPVHLECVGEADRAKTLVWLLQGICGVSDEKHAKDESGFPEFAKEVKASKERVLEDKIRTYMVKNLGLTLPEVEAIRQNILGEEYRYGFTYKSLDAVPVTRPLEKHLDKNRSFQGIPSIEVSPTSGRLFAVWYSGSTDECAANFVVLYVSDDDGKTWTGPVAVIDPPAEEVRAFDAELWFDPQRNLRIYWAQANGGNWRTYGINDGIFGVWESTLYNPEAAPEKFSFSPSRRISHGIMMNKPTVLKDGTWCMPASVWASKVRCPRFDKLLPIPKGAYCVVSVDNGKTYELRGMANTSGRHASFDEHSIVEMKDGSLNMYIRRLNGMGISTSQDKGRTWSEIKDYATGPNSRTCVRRLASGNLIRIDNDVDEAKKNGKPARSCLTAWLSEDEGKTWKYKMLLDGRSNVSYPDLRQTADGSIYVIYDHERYKGGYFFCSKFTEDDIKAGKLLSPNSFLAREVNHVKGVRP